ncbi:hypothetical protein ACEWY4_005432 [Coilia grayii]|uniref:P-type ATPase N-terminal domain-containing protein n=1 Tax=Coilia grayii TaxID=363190 RepID=A0ABD1KIJ8_9TELE
MQEKCKDIERKVQQKNSVKLKQMEEELATVAQRKEDEWKERYLEAERDAKEKDSKLQKVEKDRKESPGSIQIKEKNQRQRERLLEIQKREMNERQREIETKNREMERKEKESRQGRREGRQKWEIELQKSAKAEELKEMEKNMKMESQAELRNMEEKCNAIAQQEQDVGKEPCTQTEKQRLKAEKRCMAEEAKRDGDRSLEAEREDVEIRQQIEEENQGGGQRLVEVQRSENKDKQRQTNEEKLEIEIRVERQKVVEKTERETLLEVVPKEVKKAIEAKKENVRTTETAERQDEIHLDRDQKENQIHVPGDIEKPKKEVERGGKQEEEHNNKEKKPTPGEECYELQEALAIKKEEEQQRELEKKGQEEARRLEEVNTTEEGKLPQKDSEPVAKSPEESSAQKINAGQPRRSKWQILVEKEREKRRDALRNADERQKKALEAWKEELQRREEKKKKNEEEKYWFRHPEEWRKLQEELAIKREDERRLELERKWEEEARRMEERKRRDQEIEDKMRQERERQREIDRQKQRELELQQQLELDKQRELERQRETERQKELERQRVQERRRELEMQRQRQEKEEMERKKQEKELETQRELKRQRELDMEKQQEREREMEIQRQREEEEMERKRQEEELEIESQTEMEQGQADRFIDTAEESQPEDGNDGPVARDKSVRRRFLGWVNQKIKERHQRKIERTIEREENEGDEPYFQEFCQRNKGHRTAYQRCAECVPQLHDPPRTCLAVPVAWSEGPVVSPGPPVQDPLMERFHWVRHRWQHLVGLDAGRGWYTPAAPLSTKSPLDAQDAHRLTGKSRTVVAHCGPNLSEHRSTCKGYQGNRISTTKYSLLSFIPKNLFEQFHRAANLYFLFLVLLNWVPAVEAFQKEITMIPLAVVLTVIAIKDALEDYRRYRYDQKINDNITAVYCG